MKQLNISLPDHLREQLHAASTKAGHSIGEEVRRRLEQSFENDGLTPETRKFMSAIGGFTTLVKLQTQHLDWHAHAGAHAVFRQEILSHLARLKPEGEPVFAPGELATAPLVASDDPQAIGQGLEAIYYFNLSAPMTPERRERLDRLQDETLREVRRRHNLEEDK